MALSDNPMLRVDSIFASMLACVSPERQNEFESYRGQMMHIVKRNINNKAVMLLKTMFLSLYSYDTDALRLDTTKLVVLGDKLGEISKEERRNLLRVLWKSAQVVFPDEDYAVLFNDWVSRSNWRKMQESDGINEE